MENPLLPLLMLGLFPLLLILVVSLFIFIFVQIFKNEIKDEVARLNKLGCGKFSIRECDLYNYYQHWKGWSGLSDTKKVEILSLFKGN
ncbi:MAG: hypothetical protein PHE89_03795 [Alphaproteobacteria bacterium]|nr:hypothetical protein [Alphaproteobacteria bacterium]